MVLQVEIDFATTELCIQLDDCQVYNSPDCFQYVGLRQMPSVH